MKFLKEYSVTGDIRVRHVFLILPHTEYNDILHVAETRWLEWAWIEEEYRIAGWGDPNFWGFCRFVNEKRNQYEHTTSA